MKVRSGFVSNSSSSSFIAIGTIINIEDITKKNMSDIVVVGGDLNDGVDIIHLTDELMLKFFKLYKTYKSYGDVEDEFIFYKVLKYISDGNKLEFTKDELLDDENYIIIDEDSDYASSKDIERLFERYTDIDDSDVKKHINKLYREQKIKRVLNEN